MLAVMNWPKILSDLADAGLSQAEIARELRIQQPSVSDIANGKTKRPSWDVGNGLLKLHRKHCRAKSAA
jgi:predicted XRE-type DNA-binding protein